MSLDSAVASRRQRHDTFNAYACYEKKFEGFSFSRKIHSQNFNIRAKESLPKLKLRKDRSYPCPPGLDKMWKDVVLIVHYTEVPLV